jgi:hypothetical protein
VVRVSSFALFRLPAEKASSRPLPFTGLLGILLLATARALLQVETAPYPRTADSQLA